MFLFYFLTPVQVEAELVRHEGELGDREHHPLGPLPLALVLIPVHFVVAVVFHSLVHGRRASDGLHRRQGAQLLLAGGRLGVRLVA